MDLSVFDLYRFWHTPNTQNLVVNLSKTKVLDASVKKFFKKTLVKMPNLHSLHLNLDHVKITDVSLLTFAQDVVPKLQQVQDLRLALFGTQITPYGTSEAIQSSWYAYE